MAGYISGETIKTLRERAGITQKTLASTLMITNKAVSKWETGRGLPDITLVEPLARALKVSVAELFSGSICENRNRAGNMRRGWHYVCPICGNSFYALGEGSFCCCGASLPPLEPEQPDDEHEIETERVENEYFISMKHPREKEHYISFISVITADRINTVKL
ncbi:MAG: helix-turn-helix transcriptional regulator [Eubacteriales bacterium]|nr:helix-turn-helix transcriptional regulator [Eubacteriales bacterium]MDD3882498.1 helix-turn-helix transcriptional regulator [Eubacteriales bacterium]MDD4512798.1 helix-turn-helix transcriptional regulator [Eubacteriales bacterium]